MNLALFDFDGTITVKGTHSGVRLEARDGVLTGRYLRGDCCGEEKMRRIRERYTLTDYATIYAYGDAEGSSDARDGRPALFRWQEVRDVPAISRATRRGDGGT
jgi:phosphoserine phosphatase